MTDNEIIKALECCQAGKDYNTACRLCPIKSICNEDRPLLRMALDLINRQKAEIERLNELFREQSLSRMNDMMDIAEQSITEFAERLKKHFVGALKNVVLIDNIDNLVKEMMEDKDNE